jgi:hypothetical protein
VKVVFVTEAQPELVLLSERAPGRRRHDWLDGGESTREEGDDKSTAFAAAGLHGLDRSAVWHDQRRAERLHAAAAGRRRRARHDLRLGGGPLCALVFAENRLLTATDEVDLLDGLIDEPVVRAVAVSLLSPRRAHPAEREAGYLSARSTDPTLIGLTLLHRNRSLSAEPHLQSLDGFVRPAVAH